MVVVVVVVVIVFMFPGLPSLNVKSLGSRLYASWSEPFLQFHNRLAAKGFGTDGSVFSASCFVQ